jgi:hypothetical protein
MNEHSFVKTIHNTLRGRGDIYVWKVMAVANNGVPDAYYSATNDLWCEYKSVRSGRDNGLSELQRRWLDARYSEGRSCWLVVLTKHGVRVYDSAPFPKRLEDGYEQHCMTIQEFKSKLINFLVT